jgi:hypothetical protein
MAKIKFEKDSEKSNGWTWHYGSVEINEVEYPFSILEMYDKTSDTSQFDLTWCDDTPENSSELESEIYELF